MTPAQWIEKNFHIPETKDDPELNGKIPLQPYQRDAVNEALGVDEEGNFKYSIIVWSDCKKSAKSTIAGAVGLWMADTRPWVEGYFIANDIKQADSRSAKYARRAIQLSPYLNENFINSRYQIKHKYNGSFLEAIPVDPEGEAGANPDCLFYSELWGATDDAKARMWSESTLSPTKFAKSFRWVETYAGFMEESEILYSLWEMGVLHGHLLWPDKLYPVTGGSNGAITDHTPLELYVNEEARLLCLWNTQPRCPWQTQEYYASEESVLHPLEFLRMHRNQWVAQTDTYIPMEWWYAGERTKEEMPEIPFNHSFVIALDAAVTSDCFGMNLVCRHPDREKHPDDSILAEEYEWTPDQYGGKIDYIGTINRAGPETVLRSYIMKPDAFKEWYLGYFVTYDENNDMHKTMLNELLAHTKINVVLVAYDPYQLHDMANRLGNKEQLAWFKAFPQGSGKHSRQISDSDLRDKIRMRRIWYNDKPKTSAHLQNADAKIDSEERRVRIVKRTEKLKVDLAVALSMADYELFRLNL